MSIHKIPEVILIDPKKFFWFIVDWAKGKGINIFDLCTNDMINAEKDYLKCHK